MEALKLDSWFVDDGRPSVRLLAWCPDCRQYHLHGEPKEKFNPSAATFGHRAVHCEEIDKLDYTLLNRGAAPKSILRDAIRRRPKGPVYVLDRGPSKKGLTHQELDQFSSLTTAVECKRYICSKNERTYRAKISAFHRHRVAKRNRDSASTNLKR